MSDSNDQNRSLNTRRGVRTRSLIVITYVAVTLLVLAFVCLNEYVVSVQDQVRSGQSPPRIPRELIDLQGREDALLNAQEPLDSAGTHYRIPIDRAMELMAEESTSPGSGR
ncbi:MAG: hypothetical protein OEV49_00155 [candidate division Zixibacteria bacterium]|nr:hypothetical protein [candidate division Zixibacteria bacterium]MDH4034322.1 hypothetical protein [candidate division Zixibacteria bacterium]